MSIAGTVVLSGYLSAMWAAVGPALGNHLWQSTLFAAVAGLLTLSMHKNHAQARYWLWMAASLKFLFPFWLLVELGRRLAWSHSASAAGPGFYSVMEVVGNPFAPGLPANLPPIGPSATVSVLPHALPVLAVGIWLCGVLAVLFSWCERWRRISATVREASPLCEGREVETLRRLEQVAGIRKPINLRLSRSSFEPGIFGIFRPLLLWPEGISARLNDAQMEAILTHEVWHVRRRDNLAAAIHMLVEALFWFHPLVWWLGARLIEERELACDEQVLQMGFQPQVYAESILKTCEFCVESPLACLSGVTGADLKKRMVHIMTDRFARKLGIGRKLLLLGLGVAVAAGPVVFGLVNAQPLILAQLLHATEPPQSFEVASIKPSRPDEQNSSLVMDGVSFKTTNATARSLIKFAYKIQNDNQLSGGPGWIDSDKYDVDAKEEAAFSEKLRKLPFPDQATQVSFLVQRLLAERFNLKAHYLTKDLPVYALVVAKSGPKITPTKATLPVPGNNSRPSGGCCGIRLTGNGHMEAVGAETSFLTDVLSFQPEIGRTVIDKTGLEGRYDWTLTWTPVQSDPFFRPANGGPPSAAPAPVDSPGPSLFTAIQEQLGLKLESRKGPVETLVIDSIDKPSPN